MICSTEKVLESYGGDYRVMCIGFAIANRYLKVKHSSEYVVLWHDGKINK